MARTRLSKKIAEKEGKPLSPLRKLPSPKRKRATSSLAKSDAVEGTPSKKKQEAKDEVVEEKEEPKKEEDVAQIEEQENTKEQESSDDEIEGFESTDDEQDDQDNEIDENQEDEETPKKTESLKKKETDKSKTHEVKHLPKESSKSSKKSSKSQKGVIYIGRLPEGFEEKELTKYFNQFGDITNVKVPRNKTTGRSRHFAFVEFSNKDDAKVAQETMNNYLILNHQLKVNLIDDEFKETSKFKKQYFKVTKLTSEKIKTLNSNSEKKKKQRKDALKAAGIKF